MKIAQSLPKEFYTGLTPKNLRVREDLQENITIPFRSIAYVKTGKWDELKGTAICVILTSGEHVVGYVDNFFLEKIRGLE